MRSTRRAVPALAAWFVIVVAVCGGRGWAADRGVGPLPQDGTAIVEGVVSYDGPIPDPIPVAEAGTVRHLIEVEPDTRGLKNALAWLEGVPEPARPGGPAPQEPVVMDQSNFAFIPHVLAVEAGRPVEFRNSDVANHGVIATSSEAKNRFDVVTPPGGHHVHRFLASKEPVAIGCPIHTSMAAWIYVLDHPYHAVTDEAGRFRLPPVSPGRYKLQVRHPDAGLRRQLEVVVRAGETARLRIHFHGDDRGRREPPATAPAR
jgi:plastocyanin